MTYLVMSGVSLNKNGIETCNSSRDWIEMVASAFYNSYRGNHSDGCNMSGVLHDVNSILIHAISIGSGCCMTYHFLMEQTHFWTKFFNVACSFLGTCCLGYFYKTKLKSLDGISSYFRTQETSAFLALIYFSSVALEFQRVSLSSQIVHELFKYLLSRFKCAYAVAKSANQTQVQPQCCTIS